MVAFVRLQVFCSHSVRTLCAVCSHSVRVARVGKNQMYDWVVTGGGVGISSILEKKNILIDYYPLRTPHLYWWGAIGLKNPNTGYAYRLRSDYGQSANAIRSEYVKRGLSGWGVGGGDRLTSWAPDPKIGV